MKFTRYYAGASLCCVLASAALMHFANRQGTAEEAGKPAAAIADGGVAIGSVVMWWGSRDAVPAGWEICDGNLAKTIGATLAGKKPNLVDRFPKGALSIRSTVKDLSEATGGNNNMPALQIAKIDGLQVAEDGAHTHAPIERAAGTTDAVDQADNQDSSEIVLARGKSARKASAATDGDDDSPSNEGSHSHKLKGFVGTEDGVNADGKDHTGANQPAYAEMFFIIRVK